MQRRAYIVYLRHLSPMRNRPRIPSQSRLASLERGECMNPIDLRIPDECGARIVFNSLYPVKQIPNLIQDVIFIELPNDDYLDVGWYPEHDPNGSYRISLYHGDWSNQLIDPIIATNEIEVARRVRDIIVERCRPTTVTI